MGNTTSILAIEVGSYCKDFRVTPNCRIAFNGDEVESFGNLSVGEFPGAPDVAGEGVSYCPITRFKQLKGVLTL